VLRRNTDFNLLITPYRFMGIAVARAAPIGP